MKVHIKYFASIRETIGLSAEALETEAPTLAEQRSSLQMRLLRWPLLWLLLPRCRRHSSDAAVAVPHSHAVAASRTRCAADGCVA